MRHDDVIVRCPVTFELVCADHPPVPAQVELRYAHRDPYAVVVAFQTERSREVVWRFSRELLDQGLDGPAGDGDVRLRPLLTPRRGGLVEVELRSPVGRAVFHAPRAELRRYLARTRALIAPGTEHDWLDLDHVVTMLTLTRLRAARRDP